MERDNTFDKLRQRTEKLNLDSVLKGTLGGYTKASVMDYVRSLNETHEQDIEQLRKEITVLVAEKEALTKDQKSTLDKYNALLRDRSQRQLQQSNPFAKSSEEVDELVDSLESEVRNLKEKVQTLTEEKQGIEKQLQASNGKNKDLEDELAKGKRERDVLEDSVTAWRVKVDELANSNKNLRSKFSSLEKSVDDTDITQLKDISEKQALSFDKLAKELEECRKQRDKLSTALSECMKQRDKLVNSLAEAREAYEESQKVIDSLYETADRLASKNQELETLVRKSKS